jgi:DeoR family transcriptional regulator of aga operon
MRANDRRAAMLSEIAEHGFVSTADLAATFAVSEVTVRSDLAALVPDGVERVHGGAVLRPGGAEQPFELSAERLAEQKRRIGEAAAALVQSGTAIAIDVGTTGVALAHALVRRAELERVTIITNSISAALALEPGIPRFDVIVSGGTLRPLQHSLVAPFAAEGFQRLRVDTAFIGCTGVDATHGITNINVAEAELKRVIAGIAARVVVIADASKLGRVDPGHVLALEEVSTLVTGAEADAAAIAPLRAAGLAVALA